MDCKDTGVPVAVSPRLMGLNQLEYPPEGPNIAPPPPVRPTVRIRMLGFAGGVTFSSSVAEGLVARAASAAPVNWLAQQVEYVPFLDFHPAHTLILGAGAGKDVLQARLCRRQCEAQAGEHHE